MNEIHDAIHKLGIVRLEIDSVIKKLKEAEDAGFEVLCLISSAEYGKQRFFKESTGLIYDRKDAEYLHDCNAALEKYLKEVSDETQDD